MTKKKLFFVGILLAIGLYGIHFYFKTKEIKKIEALKLALSKDFEKVKKEARSVYVFHQKGLSQNGKVWWNKQKLWIIKKYGEEAIVEAKWKHPAITPGFDPNDKQEDFDEAKNAMPIHFLNQIKRIPLQQLPTAQCILQIALNVGQGIEAGSVMESYILDNFITFELLEES